MQQIRWGPHDNLHTVSALFRPIPHSQALRPAPCPLPPPHRRQFDSPVHTLPASLHATPGPMPPQENPHKLAAQPLQPNAPPQHPSGSPSLNPSTHPTCIQVYGVDFTSRPTPRKPLTVAHGQLLLPQRVLRVHTLSRLVTHRQLSDLLFGPGLDVGGDKIIKEDGTKTQAAPAPETDSLPSDSCSMRCKEGTPASATRLPPPAQPSPAAAPATQHAAPNTTTTCTSTDPTPASTNNNQHVHVRVAALDFPFGQPRGLVDALGWGPGWRDLVRHATQLRSQAEFEAALKAFMARQPPGAKHLKRAVAAHSCEVSPMSLVRTPTAKMFWVGAGLLAAAADAGRALLPHHLPPPQQQQQEQPSRPLRQTPPCSCTPAELQQYGRCPTSQEELQEGSRHGADPAATYPPLGDSPGEHGHVSVSEHVSVPLPVCVCVEAYPALPARRVLSPAGSGSRAVSYKSDAAAGAADNTRRQARRAVLRALLQAAEPAGPATVAAVATPAALEGSAGALECGVVDLQQQKPARGLAPGGEEGCAAGCGGSEAQEEVDGGGRGTAVSLAVEYGLQRVELEAAVARQCEEDPSGDSLDAVLAALQAAWAALRGPAGNWGGPPLIAGIGSMGEEGGGGGGAGGAGGCGGCGASSELMERDSGGQGGGAGAGGDCGGAGGAGVDPVEGWVADPGVWAAHCAEGQQKQQGGGEQGQGSGKGRDVDGSGRVGGEGCGAGVAAGGRGPGGKRKRAGS